MKKLTYTLLCLVVGYSSAYAQSVFDQTDQLLQRYVKNGAVDYQGLKRQSSKLNELILQVEQMADLEIDSNEEKALLINAYNLAVLKGIVDRLPVASPQAIPSFFDQKRITIDGKRLSLNQLEKEILIKQTGDARLHFALVCAAKGCPLLVSEAYRPERLEEQLERQTRRAMNDPFFTRVDDDNSSVEVSQLFNWHKGDFTKNGTVLDFINRYRKTPISENYKISFYEYDWSLNAVQIEKKTRGTGGTSNLLQFTPSQLFRKGQYEINVFNNLYSQTSVRDKDGIEIPQDRRLSILTSMIQFTYGVSAKARINLGADVILSAGSIGLAPGSQTQLFGNTLARDIAVTAIGPRVKFQPFRKFPFYSIQSSFLFPVAPDPEGQTDVRDVFLALNRYQWKTQFFYDLKLTEQLRLFYEFDVIYWIRRNPEEVFFETNFVDLPAIAFLNYFPTNKLNLFLNAQYNGRYGNTVRESTENIERRFGLLQWTLQVGGGVKYQVSPRIGFEVSYSNFVAGKGFEGIEAGAGEVVNFGIRFIK